MDLIDKNILYELLVNCRTSYQTLANKLDLTVNAVKKRIQKLEASGIIREYTTFPSLAMLDAEMTLAIIKTKTPTTEDAFLDKIGAHPWIYAASILTNGDVLCFGHYIGSKGLDEFGTFLRQVEGVTDVEFHTLLAEKGTKFKLTPPHLKVIQCLIEDARLPMAEIAKRTQLTPRRVRSILQELGGKSGSEPSTYLHGKTTGDIRTTQACFHFRMVWNLNAGGYTPFIIRIQHEGGAEKRGKVVEWLRTKYPFMFWYAYTSAFNPIIFCVFVVEHMRESTPILAEIGKAPGVASARAIFGYPTKRYKGVQDVFFEDLLKSIDES